MRRTLLRSIGAFVAVLAAAYIAAAGYLYFFQRDTVFRPSGTLASIAELKLDGLETVAIAARDGAKLAGWYAEAAPGLPTILYFHGNAGSLTDRAERFRTILGSGLGLLAMSYRGYPGSEGSPSEAALVSDALEIFDWLAARSDAIVIHGESLGTGVATQVAAGREARALVLEAPFTAALDLAAATYPWVPTGLLMRDPFLSREHIRQVEEPVLIVHGTADRVIPVEHGRRLFALAREPKRLAIIEGGGHGDLWNRGIWEIELDFLRGKGLAVQPEAAVRRMPSFAG